MARHAPSPLGKVLLHQRQRRDEDQREIVLLRDEEDRSYGASAELLQLPKGTVKSRLHRARAELARRLSRKVGLEDVV